MSKKQKELPGIEKPVIKEVEESADDYVAVRDRRMKLTESEVEKRTGLLAVMKKHKLSSYAYDGFVITIEENEKVKVKKASDPEDGDNE